jgi:glycosyltransferase involved in cell wall biosynthesis
MRILHITRETGSDSRYGIRKGLLPVIRALEGRGHYVEIFDQDKAMQQQSGFLGRMLEKLWLIRVRWILGQDMGAVGGFISERIKVGRRAARYANKGRFTHVHCHDPLLAYTFHSFRWLYGATPCWGYSLSAYGRFVKKRIGIEAGEKAFRFLESWEMKAAGKANWVFAQTRIGLEQMRLDLGFEKFPANWYIVGNPVIKLSGARLGTRQKLGIRDDQKLILAVGQLIPMKRFDLLLHALSLLPNGLSFFVIILGEGPEKRKLTELAVKYGFEDSLRITITDTIGDYYAAADLFVSTSSTESYANASCEALLAGLPAVCTAVGGVPELLQGGTVLTGDEPKEIAEAIFTLLTSDEVRLKLLAEAQRITAAWNPPEFFAAAREKIMQGCCRNHFALEKQPDTQIQPKEKTLPTAHGEFRLRAYRAEDRDALMDLWQLVFGKEMDPKVWDWKYGLCPYPVLSLVCLNAEGQPVVFYAGIAYPCRHYGRYGELVHLVDNMTHPGYRQMIAGRKGLFLETARHFFIENETAGDCRYFYGFPGERNHKLAKLFLNGRDFHSGPAYLVYDLPEKPAMHSGGVFAKQLKLPSPARLDAFWHRVSVHYPVSVIRDHRFLQWRYFRHPVNTYRFYASKDFTGRYNAWIVAMQEEETLILVDMLFAPWSRGVSGLLTRIRKAAMAAGIRKIVTWLPEKHFTTGCLLANGFKQWPEPLGIRPIGRIPANDVLPRPWVEGEVYYTMGDGDVC